MSQDIVENPANLYFWWESKVYHSKLSLYSPRNLVPTSTWWTHRCNKLNVFNFLEDLVLRTIEPTSIVHPLSEQFERRLWKVGVFFGHVQIIDEDDHLFTIRNHLGLGPANHLSFNHFLCFGGTGLTGVYYIVDLPITFVEFTQDLVDEHSLTSPSNSHTQSMYSVSHTTLQNIFGSGRVNSRNQQTVISSSWRRLPYHVIDFLIPALPFAFVRIDVVIKDSEVSREEGFDIPHNRVKGFPANLIESSPEGPNHAEDKPFL